MLDLHINDYHNLVRSGWGYNGAPGLPRANWARHTAPLVGEEANVNIRAARWTLDMEERLQSVGWAAKPAASAVHCLAQCEGKSAGGRQ